MSTASLSRAERTASFAPLLFTATIFLSASLLFFVQPLFTKIVLPHIGGTPAIWTSAMLFFQTVLIAGYLYAHFLTRYVPTGLQVAVHLVLWSAALAFLPLSIAEGWIYDADGSAILQTLGLFAVGVGLPFAVLSANAPLIQSWYSRTDGPSAHDPYFLYGASNLGSLMALLAFPLVAEPLFGATRIGLGWAAGFVLLGLFLLLSGLSAMRSRNHEVPRAEIHFEETAPATVDLLRWAVIAFVPSSLMLAVTSKMSTDLGSVPLLWVIPLALFLLTFVLTFTHRTWISDRGLTTGAVLGIAYLTMVFSGLLGHGLGWIEAGAMVLAFFAIAMFAHRTLYWLRPGGAHLTLFYVTMSVGGALGGLFNSVIAPIVFTGLYEGAVTIFVAAALLFFAVNGSRPHGRDAAIGVILAGLLTLPLTTFNVVQTFGNWDVLKYVFAAIFAAMLILSQRRPATVLSAVLVVSIFGLVGLRSEALFRDRSFFGTHQVRDRADDAMRVYSNGTTVHGAQRLSELDAERPSPLFYYISGGPLGQIMQSDIATAAHRVGVVGLGVGALACYAQPGQDWHFYEIDKTVDDVARNPALFTFLSSCTPNAPTHMGDARMVLERQTDMRFDVLVIDAYSSDAVPVHLTTTEAMQLYLDRLTPGGVLMYHISNRYYEIHRPLATSAAALDVEIRLQNYEGHLDHDEADVPSKVALITKNPEVLEKLDADPRWQTFEPDGLRLWTDDYANALSILSAGGKH